MKIKTAILLLFVLFVCSTFGQKILVYGDVDKPMYYLPYFSDDAVTLRVLDLLFETLVKDFSNAVKTKDNVNIPALSSNLIFLDTLKVDFSSNPQMKMTLRNVTFGDGTKLTPDDVVFTVEKIIKDRQISTVYKYLVMTIRDVRSSEMNLEVNFFFPSKYMVSSMEIFVLPSLKIRNVTNYLKLKNLKLQDLRQFLTGPYYVSYEDETSIEFSLNPRSTVRPRIEKIKLVKIDVAKNMVDRFLQGELDFITPATHEPEFKKLETEGSIKSFPSFDKKFIYLAFNYNNKIFHDKNLRILISKSIDKQQIKELFQGAGEIISGPFHPNFPGTDPNIKPYEYTPDASEELKKYAKTIGSSFKLIYQRDPLRRNERIAALIAGSLKDSGIKVEILGLSSEQYYEALREGSIKSFDMALVEYYTTSSFASIRPLLDENGPLNYGKFNSRINGSYDNYLTGLLNDVEGDNAFRIRDDVRFQKYREIHKLCHENEYHVWLFAPQTKVYYNSNKVKVSYFSPERPFKNIADWDVIK
ncbi:MAG: ABC transporter substrate-binding protein [Candidatus Kryptonium sp.]|nr:ABC transporter substrate-binding protein [Candidatus Kryptonium sp.]